MRLIAGWCVGCLALSCITGCAMNTDPIERSFNRMMSEVVGPAVVKAIAETKTDAASLAGGAQVIEPGYEVTFEGFFGTGVKGVAVVRLVGVSGQLTGHAQTTSTQP